MCLRMRTVGLPWVCRGPWLGRRPSLQLPAQGAQAPLRAWLSQRRSAAVRLRHICHAAPPCSDKADVKLTAPTRDRTQSISIPWAMQMKAISIEDPSRLVQILTGAILGCGGWVLSRGANDTGTVNMLFEFERQSCVDIYSVMIVRMGRAAAQERGHQLADADGDRPLSSGRAGRAVLLQLAAAGGHGGAVCAGHQRRHRHVLSPAAHASRLPGSQVAGIRDGHLRHAGAWRADRSSG
jgi:hypothetical protein